MEKSTLLKNLDEQLKNIHHTNLPYKRLAIKAVNLVCDEPNTPEYKVIVDKQDADYFMRTNPFETNATFEFIFQKIGMPVKNLGSGGGEGGEYIRFKLAS